MDSAFVTGMVKGFGDVAPQGRWMIRAGNAANGRLLTQFDGPRPAQAPGRAAYYPMRLTGSLILGIGGDNSDGAAGVFFEGCVLKGASSEAADVAAQADINGFYSRLSLPVLPPPPPAPPSPTPPHPHPPAPGPPPKPAPNSCDVHKLTNETSALNHYCQTNLRIASGGFCTVLCPSGEEKRDVCRHNGTWTYTIAELCFSGA